MGQLLGTLFGPIGSLFHYVFYEPVYNLLMLLYHVTSSFALSIVLLTVILRLCLLPLTRKQLQSSRKMQELQPQIKALQVQYRGNPQGLMAAQRALFKENNYSQAQGCLPLLIQMPVLYSLFYAFRTVIGTSTQTVAQHLASVNADIYPFLPKVTHLLTTKFLWVNLAQPDPIHLLPLLAAVLTFIQLRMAMPVRPKPQPGAAPDATAQASKYTMYLMPFVTFIFGLSFPAGMALYWSVGTMFMVVQQYFLAGFGSLFLGIPGMERFVPEPKQTLAVAAPVGRNGARPGTYSAATSARSALVETPSARTRPTASPAMPSPSPVSGGVIGRLREQWATVQRQAQEAAAARAEALAATNSKIVDSTAEVDTDEDDMEQPVGAAQADASESARAQQRQRPTKQAPQLVKPSHAPAVTALPNATIPRVGTNGNGATKPLQADANAANGLATSNGANGAKATNGSNGTNGANGSNGAVNVRRVTNGTPSNTRPLNGSQRKGSGGAKGSAATRTRPAGSPNGASTAGRPKGGR